MSKRRKGLFEYLENAGILERNDAEEIRLAKISYRREYQKRHKQSQRRKRPEYTISFSIQNGDLDRVQIASKRHKRPVSEFVKFAVLAYISDTFVVPDRAVLAEVHLMTADCLNFIQKIVSQKTSYDFEQTKRFEEIEKKISTLEENLNALFCRPVKIEKYIFEALKKNPSLKQEIQDLLTNYDSKTAFPFTSDIRPIA